MTRAEYLRRCATVRQYGEGLAGENLDTLNADAMGLTDDEAEKKPFEDENMKAFACIDNPNAADDHWVSYMNACHKLLVAESGRAAEKVRADRAEAEHDVAIKQRNEARRDFRGTSDALVSAQEALVRTNAARDVAERDLAALKAAVLAWDSEARVGVSNMRERQALDEMLRLARVGT